MSEPSPVRLDIDGRIGVITVHSPPVNALSYAVRAGLMHHLKVAAVDLDVDAIIVLCDGRTFIAGADIKELGKPLISPVLREIQLAMEDLQKPLIAAIHGTALGGGLELALAAHYRIAVPSARCGLPEVKLGILPGAGGTQRLPRIVGVKPALELLTSGNQIDASAAKVLGLVDVLAGETTLRADAIAFAREIVAQKKPLMKVRDRSNCLDSDPDVFADFRARHAERFRGYDAPELIIRCVEAAIAESFDEGLRFERECFDILIGGDQASAMRYQFFAQRQAGKPAANAADATAPYARAVLSGSGAATRANLLRSRGIAVVMASDPTTAAQPADDLWLEAGEQGPAMLFTADRGTAGLLEIRRFEAGPHSSVLELVAESDPPPLQAAALLRPLTTITVLARRESPALTTIRALIRAASQLADAGVPVDRIDRILHEFGFATDLAMLAPLAGLSFRPPEKGLASDWSDADILAACLLPVIDAAAALIDKGVVARASDIDVLWTHGLGWPLYRGGPIFYGNQLGAVEALDRLISSRARTGDAAEPSAALARAAAKGDRIGEAPQ